MRKKTIIAVLGLIIAGNTFTYGTTAKACQFGALIPFWDSFNKYMAEQTQLEEQETEKKKEQIEERKYIGNFEITAYCCCDYCTAGEGVTYSGTVPEEGRTISVDPDVIPLGTEVYIEGLGYYIAEDTGSAIIGNIIDLYIEEHNRASDFGRITTEVYLIY